MNSEKSSIQSEAAEFAELPIEYRRSKARVKKRDNKEPNYYDKENGVWMVWCIRCKQHKMSGEFDTQKATASGLYSYCKECRVEYRHEQRRIKRLRHAEQIQRRTK